mmetsp:Transcript_21831/g.75065  ORF Transcript_21831/g.75065 Transcript_21831/m.75065 type:complete len:97 (+) Transcript_21831:51-341(+)
MRERDLDFAYWSIDGDHFPQEATEFGEHIPGMPVDESYGLLKADYKSPRHLWKLRDVQSLMQDGVPHPLDDEGEPPSRSGASAGATAGTTGSHSEL